MSATQDEVNKQRAALLTAIATQGSAGKTAYEAEQARQAEYAKAAAASLSSVAAGPGTAPPAAFLAQLRAEAAAQQGVYAQDNKMAQTNYNNSIAQTAMSNAAYMDQARAAVPVVEAQTAGQIAQIRAQQEEQRLAREEAAKERAYNERMRALGLQEQTQGDNAEAQRYLRDMQEQGRESIFKRAQREAGPDVSDALSKVLSSSETLGQAVKYLRSNDFTDEEDKVLPNNRALTNKAIRYLYLYFTGKEPNWQDAQAFGLQLRKENVNPRHVYGYIPGGRPNWPTGR